MENGTETNYFTTTEPQDLGTELYFLSCCSGRPLPMLELTGNSPPWGNPRSVLHRFKPLKKPKKPHKTIWTCCHIPVVFPTGSEINCLSLHCASPWTPQNSFSLELPEIMMYQGMTGHLEVYLPQTCSAAHDSSAPALGSDLPPLRPLPWLLFLSFLSPAFPHTLLSLPTGSLHPKGLQGSWELGSRV